jgi:hypothetical protein
MTVFVLIDDAKLRYRSKTKCQPTDKTFKILYLFPNAHVRKSGMMADQVAWS